MNNQTERRSINCSPPGTQDVPLLNSMNDAFGFESQGGYPESLNLAYMEDSDAGNSQILPTLQKSSEISSQLPGIRKKGQRKFRAN